jgi:PAS domain S-box-containing protein
VARDVSGQKQQFERQRQNERLLRMAGASAKLGGWLVDLADGKVTWSDGVCAIHEVPAGFQPPVTAAVEFYAPESRPEIMRVVTACVEHGTPFEVELEIITARGNRRWVHAAGEAVRDAADRIVQVQGAFQDITDRRRAEAALRDSEARFRTVIQSSWDVFHLIGADGTILYESPAVTRVLGYLPEEMMGRNAFEFIHPDDAAEIARTPTVLPPSGGSHVKILRVRHKDGAWRWVESFEVNLLDHPDVKAFAVNYRDITDRKVAEESLRASEERFRAMANSMSQLAWVASADGAIHWYNQRWYEYTGATPAEMEGWGWQRVHDPERLPAVLAAWKAAIATGTPLEIDFPIRGADGHFRTFLTRAVPVRDADGRVEQWFGTNTDVEALKRVETSLRESEATLKTAQRIAGLGNWTWDIVTDDLRWSDEVFRLFGIPQDEFGATYAAFLSGVHPDDRERTDRAVKDALAGGAAYLVEHRTRAPDGTVRTLLERGEVTRDAAGRAVHMAGTVLDITERKLAEFHLAETNRALVLLSRCNEAVTRAETEDELLASVCRIAVEEGGFRMAWIGYPGEDEDRTVVPKAHAGVEDGYLSEARITWSDATAQGQGPCGRAIRGGEPVVITDLGADPTYAPWRDAALTRGYRGALAFPLRHASETLGVLALYLAEVRDLQAQELRVLRELADDLAFGVVTLRERGDRRRLQTALQKMATSVSATTGAQFFEQLAANMAEALGAEAAVVARIAPGDVARARTLAAIIDNRSVPAFDLELAASPGERVVAHGEWLVATSEVEVFGRGLSDRPGGSRGYAGRCLNDADGQPIGIVFVLFRDPIRSTAFVSSTLQIFATRAAVEVERQRAEARLREQASLLDTSQDAILVRDLDHRILYWNKSAERRYGWTAVEAVGRSARELLCDDLADLEVATATTLARGEWVGELREKHKDGSPVVVEGRWSLVRDDDGVPRSILAVNTDLTERKKLKRTEDQLRQAQKMEAVGSLAGGVAHDFNNLLSVILSYTDLILEDLRPTDPFAADLEEVKKAGLRATELTRQLLAFSRNQILQPVALDLNHVVAGVTKMLGRLLGEDIELTVSMAADASRIFADAGQVEQVLMNLVVNARDAMPLGGNLTIETASVELDASYTAAHVGVRAGPYVMLAVSDNGHGMDDATQARIFEPFFTTKDKSKGTGLGLSTVFGIVQQSGGHIAVYSEPGVGTTFKVYLPQSDRVIATPTLSAPASSLRGKETILLVEDEEQVRTIIRTILRRQGYHVLEAQNGGEAFLVCEQFKAKIHLLLTDVVMPRMSGRQLAERLAAVRPEMKILYISGYTENTIVHHGVLDAGIEFLAKPIMPEALLRKVRAVLDGGGRA